MHSLIVGMTSCGKTTLAKKLSRMGENAGKKIVVLEPVKTTWTGNEYHVENAEDLCTLLMQNKNLYVFVDESGETIGRDNDYQFLATRSRQYGHSVFFIMQRTSQVLPIIRSNCSCVYAFRQSAFDCEILCREYAQESFRQCANLKRGEFLQWNIESENVEKLNAFNVKK